MRNISSRLFILSNKLLDAKIGLLLLKIKFGNRIKTKNGYYNIIIDKDDLDIEYYIDSFWRFNNILQKQLIYLKLFILNEKKRFINIINKKKDIKKRKRRIQESLKNDIIEFNAKLGINESDDEIQKTSELIANIIIK